MDDSAAGWSPFSEEKLRCLTLAVLLVIISYWIVYFRDYFCRVGWQKSACGHQGHPVLCGAAGKEMRGCPEVG